MTKALLASSLMGLVLTTGRPVHAAEALPATAATYDFEKDIRPILEKSCVSCHGPKKQKGGFRVDSRDELMKGGIDGIMVVSGKSAESELVRYVAYLEDGFEMPPDEEDRLPPAEIALLRAWIDAGAPYPNGGWLDPVLGAKARKRADARNHWAFKAPVKPAVPTAAKDWTRNPIDAFVLHRLQKDGLSPAAAADPVTLLRRAHLDLVGVPPTIAEWQAFAADRRPGAYERAVERLLASPRYGERWARPWLDAARYADTDGYEKDLPRVMWLYRDWVINALNRDLPYDQFITQQIAGDLLPGAGQNERVATGYLRNSMVNEEGGVHPEQFRMEALFDRLDAIGKGVLGLTVQCTQCHDHKFDPIAQKEYYQLLAFLNANDEALPVAYTPAQEKERLSVLRKIAEIERKLRVTEPSWRTQMQAWEAAEKAKAQPRWTALQAPFNDDSTGGEKFLLQKDGSFLAQSYSPPKASPWYEAKSGLRVIRAFRLEFMTDPNLPHGGPGRSREGTLALAEFRVEAVTGAGAKDLRPLKFRVARADTETPESLLDERYRSAAPEDKAPPEKRRIGPAAFAIDNNDDTAYSTNLGPGRRNENRDLIFWLEQPFENPGDVALRITVLHRHAGWHPDGLTSQNIGRFRISATGDAVPDEAPLPPSVRMALDKSPKDRSPADLAALFGHYRKSVPAWARANADVERVWAQHPEGVTALTLSRRTEPRTTHILQRGDYLKPGDPVETGAPGVLHPLDQKRDEPPRLAFARWLVDRRSPTTARVIVNRIWQAYFGTGLVKTVDDFGTQGEAPSHPELLDWLAVEFMERGWHLKDLHRLIVLSSTYRQNSDVSAPLLERDPENRLLARGPRMRVPAEVLRDVFLATSGLLVEKVGGPSVMAPAPLFLARKPVSYGWFPWVDAQGPDRYRRALYTYRRRSMPYPMLEAFDAPPGETACVQRVKSNTPMQALVTMNEPLSVEAAQALGRRMVEVASDDRQRIEHGFARVLSRLPRAEEMDMMLGLLQRQRGRLADGWADPWSIAAGKGERPESLPKNVTPSDLAAFTVVGRVLLNLDEAITKS